MTTVQKLQAGGSSKYIVPKPSRVDLGRRFDFRGRMGGFEGFSIFGGPGV